MKISFFQFAVSPMENNFSNTILIVGRGGAQLNSNSGEGGGSTQELSAQKLSKKFSSVLILCMCLGLRWSIAWPDSTTMAECRRGRMCSRKACNHSRCSRMDPATVSGPGSNMHPKRHTSLPNRKFAQIQICNMNRNWKKGSLIWLNTLLSLACFSLF